jgi:hypothetical protein
MNDILSFLENHKELLTLGVLTKQVAEYLTYFRYGRVITMAKKMGHRFPDVKPH